MKFQQDENNSASENDVNEMEEEDEQVEEEDEEESEDDTDDDISVVTEEDMLSDPSALTYTDVVKVSKQLDELCKLISECHLYHILCETVAMTVQNNRQCVYVCVGNVTTHIL